jgi:hypothetical protein
VAAINYPISHPVLIQPVHGLHAAEVLTVETLSALPREDTVDS